MRYLRALLKTERLMKTVGNLQLPYIKGDFWSIYDGKVPDNPDHEYDSLDYIFYNRKYIGIAVD